jgi:hypothetical protein
MAEEFLDRLEVSRLVEYSRSAGGVQELAQTIERGGYLGGSRPLLGIESSGDSLLRHVVDEDVAVHGQEGRPADEVGTVSGAGAEVTVFPTLLSPVH